MKLKTIEKLCCPVDRAELELQIVRQDLQENVLEGLLSCRECERYYPIIHGVPIMNPDEYREKGLEEPLLERWQKEKPALHFKRFLTEG